MIFRELDANGDWMKGKGKNNFLVKDAAIGLNIKTRLQEWVNDCFFNMTAGIDWTNRIGSKGQFELLKADLRQVILRSEGVTGMLAFDATLIDRKVNASFTITTIYSKSYIDSVTLGVGNA